MKKALVVDDTNTDLSVVSQYLEKAGMQVIAANSGEDALAQLTTMQPDIIFLDVVLPGRSGFEVCRQIKTDSHTQKIPVVICSTKNTDMDRFWGIKQGADLYLAKPVQQTEVMDAVSKLVK